LLPHAAVTGGHRVQRPSATPRRCHLDLGENQSRSPPDLRRRRRERERGEWTGGERIDEKSAPFVWVIFHQPAVLFSQNKPAISNQPAILFSQNKPAPAISHQPNEQAEYSLKTNQPSATSQTNRLENDRSSKKR
jgi:hypothetical protein